MTLKLIIHIYKRCAIKSARKSMKITILIRNVSSYERKFQMGLDRLIASATEFGKNLSAKLFGHHTYI